MFTMQQLSDQIANLTSQIKSIDSKIFLVPVYSKADIEFTFRRAALADQLRILQQAQRALQQQ